MGRTSDQTVVQGSFTMEALVSVVMIKPGGIMNEEGTHLMKPIVKTGILSTTPTISTITDDRVTINNINIAQTSTIAIMLAQTGPRTHTTAKKITTSPGHTSLLITRAEGGAGHIPTSLEGGLETKWSMAIPHVEITTTTVSTRM